MVKSSAPSRERIVAGAADMISRRGLNATSIRELAKHAKAPLGSTYHYFPEGKGQLATEAVQYAGEVVARILRKELDAGPLAGLQAFLALWRGIVVESGFRAGCPVLAVSVEEPPAGEVRRRSRPPPRRSRPGSGCSRMLCGSTAPTPSRPRGSRRSSWHR